MWKKAHVGIQNIDIETISGSDFAVIATNANQINAHASVGICFNHHSKYILNVTNGLTMSRKDNVFSVHRGQPQSI